MGDRNARLRQPGRPTRSLQHHRLIADSIRFGDPDPEAAALAMHTHAATVGHVKLLDWQIGE